MWISIWINKILTKARYIPLFRVDILENTRKTHAKSIWFKRKEFILKVLQVLNKKKFRLNMVENRGLMVLQLTHQPIQSEAKGTGGKTKWTLNMYLLASGKKKIIYFDFLHLRDGLTITGDIEMALQLHFPWVLSMTTVWTWSHFLGRYDSRQAVIMKNVSPSIYPWSCCTANICPSFWKILRGLTLLPSSKPLTRLTSSVT